MSPISLRSGVAIACALLVAACEQGIPDSPAEGMNLLLITVDTTRADALSCYGAASGTTPAIDKLAADALLFERAYSATNVTKPSHLSIMTGRRAIEHRVFNNQVLIPEEVEALPLFMQRKGYQTAAFVAAVQLGEQTAWRGFDVVQGPRAGKPQRVGKDVVDNALNWLRASDERPFFLWTHFFDPHTLYNPPDKFAKRFYKGDKTKGSGQPIGEAPWFEGWDYKPMQRWIRGVRDPEYAPAMYAAELAYTDQQIGRLLTHLVKHDLTGNTVVVLTADHGEHLGEHGLYYDHAGLWETALHIPLIIRMPAATRAHRGARSHELVTQLDLVPTLAELFGLNAPSSSGGQSLAPLLLGEPERYSSRSSLIFESAHNHQIAIRSGDWKLIWPILLTHRFLGSEPELFNLAVDPGELNDLSAERSDIVDRLRPLLDPWIEMGTLSKGEMPTMNLEALKGLEDLGYLGD